MSASVEQARKALGARLRDIRKDAGLTARAFASAAGWHYTKVSKLENGARTPSQSDIRQWCRICRAEDQAPDLIAAARDVDIMYAEWRRQLRVGMHRAQAARPPAYERTSRFRLPGPPYTLAPKIQDPETVSQPLSRTSVTGCRSYPRRSARSRAGRAVRCRRHGIPDVQYAFLDPP